MIKIIAPSALALAILAWALTVFIGSVLLSGTALEDRSCQTACIQMLFFSGFGIGALALILAVVAVSKQAVARVLSYTALILAFPVFAVYAGIVVIGNVA